MNKTIEEISREAAEEIHLGYRNAIKTMFGAEPRAGSSANTVRLITSRIAAAIREHEKELQADKERLDWLETRTFHGRPSQSKWGNGRAVHQIKDIWTQPGLNLREAIDAAMKGAE